MATINSWGSNVPVEIAKGGTNATSMSTSTGIAKYDGTSIVTSTTAKIDSSNRMTNTSQPAFLATLSGNVGPVTGDGTVYTIIPTNVVFDNGSNYNNGTGVFTAPVTGRYMFSAHGKLQGMGAGMVRYYTQFVATSRTLTLNYCNPLVCADTDAILGTTISAMIDMTAGDTCYVTVYVQGGAKNVFLITDSTFFSGYLVC